jgi:membrane-bound serine protease (ClpP class)
MLVTIITLFAAGLLLIVAEAILPGGVAGVLGSVLIVIGAILCFREYGTAMGLLYLGVGVPTALVVGFGAFHLLMKKMALTPPEATASSRATAALVGSRGVVIVDLDPTGVVRIDGKRRQARSESSVESVPMGTEVEVVRADGGCLIVRPVVPDSGEGPAS